MQFSKELVEQALRLLNSFSFRFTPLKGAIAAYCVFNCMRSRNKFGTTWFYVSHRLPRTTVGYCGILLFNFQKRDALALLTAPKRYFLILLAQDSLSILLIRILTNQEKCYVTPFQLRFLFQYNTQIF